MAGGWEETVRQLNTLAIDLGNAAAGARELAGVAVRKTAADVEADAKLLAPVDTGFLRNSIGTDMREDSGGVEAEIGPTAEYGAHVEYGTSRAAPQAYLGPAFDRHAHELETALTQIADRTL